MERQDSAHPHHDWNERITAECYAPNAVSRILSSDGRIIELVSFNAGPTLLAWLQRHALETYQAMLDADREGRQRYGGHGPALAQPFVHAILPLATECDRQTAMRRSPLPALQERFGRSAVALLLGLPQGFLRAGTLPAGAVDYHPRHHAVHCPAPVAICGSVAWQLGNLLGGLVLAAIGSLLLVLVFGLLLNNSQLFDHFSLRGLVNRKHLRREVRQFRVIVLESAFLVRTFFFVAFGFYLNVAGVL